MTKSNLVGAAQLPLYPDASDNMVVYEWVDDKSSSLVDKIWGYKIGTRFTFLPEKVLVQEVVSSRFERAWHEFYSTLSALWNGKPEFKVSVFADAEIPTRLNEKQLDKLKSILLQKQEELKLDSVDQTAFVTVCYRIQNLLKKVAISSNFSTSPMEDFEKLASKYIKNLPKTIEAESKQWKECKEGILNLANRHFKEDPTTFLYSHADSILQMIDSTLNNENFLKDPQAYIAAWTEKRGKMDEYRIPEDPTRHFLYGLFAQKEG